MARIFKEDGLLIIEGYGSIPLKRATYSIENGIATINDLSKSKVAFHSRWENVLNEQGNQLSDQATLTQYLEESLTESPFNIDGGIIF